MKKSGQFVLCIGLTPALQRTLYFDKLKIGDVNRAARQLLAASGKACNVARTLKHLGRRSILLGFNGGTSGREMAAQLDREKLSHDFVSAEEQTRTCTTLIDTADGCVTELVEEAVWPGDETAALLLASIKRHAGDASAAVIAGALPPHADNGIYAAITILLHKFNVPVFVDTSGPAFIATRDAAPLFMKMNRDEQKKTDDIPAETFVSQTHAKGVTALLITDGKREASLFEAGSHTRFTPAVITEVNNIGSGDAATAGTVHAWLTGATMCDAVRFGLACGTANALTEIPGKIDVANVDRFNPLMVRHTGATFGFML